MTPLKTLNDRASFPFQLDSRLAAGREKRAAPRHNIAKEVHVLVHAKEVLFLAQREIRMPRLHAPHRQPICYGGWCLARNIQV